VRQEGILLRFVEAVHFVHEQEHRAASHLAQLVSAIDDRLDLAHTGGHGAEALEVRLQAGSDEACERRLAASRRSPQEQRARQLAAREDIAQRPTRAEQMRLATKLFPGARPHALGERRLRGRLVRRRRFVAEEILQGFPQ
jgi:hypothetical protein